MSAPAISRSFPLEFSAILSTSATLPSYLALSPDLHSFSRFADGGSDGNWYVGFNNAWIVELPPAPPGDFSRVFLGARLGREKSMPDSEQPWVRRLIDGKIYMAVSQAPAFTPEQEYFLVNARDIPAEPDSEAEVPGVGAPQWFWTEVPSGLVSFTRPNFLIIWSPTPYFLSASSAPILAAQSAGEPFARPHAWNNHSISGVPPRAEGGALETPLENLLPALAIKLVAPNNSEVSLSAFSVEKAGRRWIAKFSAAGRDVSRAWIESSADQIDWERSSRYLFHEPFLLRLSAEDMPAHARFLRAAAQDILGNVGYGPVLPAPPLDRSSR